MLPPSEESDDERYTRYRIIDVAVGSGIQKNLLVTVVQEEDGGKYKCGDLTISDSSFSAEIIVIRGRYLQVVI